MDLVHKRKVLAISPFLTDLRPAAQEGKHTGTVNTVNSSPWLRTPAIGTNGKAAADDG